MSHLDRVLTDAVDQGDLPFAVAMVADGRRVLWHGSVGVAGASRPAGLDTVFRIFTMSKAIGSLATVILIDRGQLEMDTPVVSIMPEFASVKVLDGFGDDGPVVHPPHDPVTVRHLLTHTSGLATATFCGKQAAWMRATGAPSVQTGTRASLHYPLMFEPGERFAYGIGIDWAGRLVERIDGRSIDRFCHEEIFTPLGMEDTAFELGRGRSRLAELRIRHPDGRFTGYEFPVPVSKPEVYNLGAALYSTAPDYLRFLQFVLGARRNDSRLVIGPTAVDLLLTNQIGDLSVPPLRSYSPTSADVHLFPGVRTTWTAAFARNEEPIPGRRTAGSLGWAGSANTHYWVDPSQELAAVFMTQLFPFCDNRVMNVFEAFERAVYATFRSTAVERRERSEKGARR